MVAYSVLSNIADNGDFDQVLLLMLNSNTVRSIDCIVFIGLACTVERIESVFYLD